MQALFRDQLGIDDFAMDGNDAPLREPWSDRPARHRTPDRKR
jgi:hypothetical protein